MSKCDKVKLSELIIQKTDTEQIVDMENEHYITLSLYGKGARERVIKDGKYPVPFTGYRVSSGQFIYSRIDARNGACAIIGPELDGFVVSKDFPVFDINESKVLPHFLRRAVLSVAFINQVKNSSFGATNRMRIKEDVFETYSIPLPELSKQNEIVDIMDRVETIINSSQQELQKLDDLIKARFVEMFGTYPANEMGWCTGTIRDVISEARYGSSRPAVEGGQYPYLRMNNITYDGELDLSDIKRIDVPDSELEKCTVRQGDVLFNRTNSKELVGKTCVYNRDEMMVLAGFVIRIRVNSRVLPVFLSSFMNTDFSKQMLLGMCRTAVGQANINAKELQDIGLYIPPIDLQQKFIDFKLQIDKSKLLEARQAGFIAKIR